jgi:hypothetical protein
LELPKAVVSDPVFAWGCAAGLDVCARAATSVATPRADALSASR